MYASDSSETKKVDKGEKETVSLGRNASLYQTRKSPGFAKKSYFDVCTSKGAFAENVQCQIMFLFREFL